MSSDPKSTSTAAAQHRAKGIRIFSYPKVIFLIPTMIAAVICWIGMLMIGDTTADPVKHPAAAAAEGNAKTTPPAAGKTTAAATPNTAKTAVEVPAKHDRFKTPQNLFAVLFLGVFAFNLLIMALDFPRFTIVAGILLVAFLVFFVLWIGAYFDYELMRAVRALMGSIYATANAEFYFLLALTMFVILAIVYVTRWLDYWEILPNEILHHHGPLSDLERYPTTNLKFDKEIPDVLEHLFLGSGRLVLHVADEKKSIVLDNVLFINSIENALKAQMSRMEVRLTTDQEVADT
jgi:hypothetical protein